MTAQPAKAIDVDLPPHGGNAVQVRETALPASNDSATVLQMIERIARDPGSDVGKLKELMAMYNDIADRNAERDFDLAMNEAQHGMAQLRADAENPQTKSRYASYSALDKALRPIYTLHGFSISYNTEPTTIPEMVCVTCRVSKGGHSRDYRIDMPADGKGAKGGDVMTRTHATGAAVTYGRRYLLSMIFNLAVERDDDGNGASNTAITEEQLDTLRTLITDLNADLKPLGIHVDIAKICKQVKVKTLEDIPAKKFDMICTSLKQWAAGELKKKRK